MLVNRGTMLWSVSNGDNVTEGRTIGFVLLDSGDQIPVKATENGVIDELLINVNICGLC